MYHDFVENWFSHSTGKIRRGTLHFSEKIFYRKSLWIGGGYHDFISKLFCLTVPKKFLGGPFLSENFWIKKMHKMVYHDFVGNWFSHSTGIIRRGTLHFSEKIFYRKSLWIGGGYHDFLSKLFCLTVTKKFLGGPFCFRKFLD